MTETEPTPFRDTVQKCAFCVRGYRHGKRTPINRCHDCGGQGYVWIIRSTMTVPPVQAFKPAARSLYDARRYERQKADMRCQDCNSQYLETETRCAVCAEKHRVANRLSI